MDLIANDNAVRQLLSFLDHIGLDPRLLNVPGLVDTLRSAPDPLPISARVIVESMAAAAELSRQPDLGLQFVEWLNPRGFGPVAAMGDYFTSYAERYRLSQDYSHLENNALAFDQEVEGDAVALTVSVRPALRPRAHQFLEGVTALNVRFARSMLGGGWSPLRVEFAHPAPDSIAGHRRFFRCDVLFGCARNAFVMTLADFRRQLPQGNPEMLAFLRGHLARQNAHWPSDLRGQVETIVAAQLPEQGGTLGQVATLLAMSPRTLQRRLAEQGTEFGAILAYVRMQIVHEHLASRTPGLDRLAHLLGFSEPSAACRFIKAQTGHSLRALAHRTP